MVRRAPILLLAIATLAWGASCPLLCARFAAAATCTGCTESNGHGTSRCVAPYMAEPAAERPTTGISPSIVALAPFAVVGWRSVVDARSTAGRADDAAGAGKRYLLLGRLVV